MNRDRLSTTERRIIDAVDLDALLADLGDLIAIPSVANEETPAQERVAAAMAALSMETDVWEIDFPRLREHPAYSADVERERGLGVVGSMGAGRGPTLILNGHTDVVPAG
ncbi:MAG: acetylornithine deacetylase, partial [Gemmatimonadetes bacterium]|nr:acetylornithine deacetylase [Gemmatimonadota bacterium]